MSGPPVFDEAFAAQFETLLAWRRDVRRFRSEPVPEALLAHLLKLTELSPSVGHSQPWRWLRVTDAGSARRRRPVLRAATPRRSVTTPASEPGSMPA